ncbi:hypothetical protein TREMEDRAFT_69058 [Tremella mesenterica DSM 1558]|uniref:uncharacterized protein n=1 Tax=Tremella mesenterica (strain ATCC 24925 / CBS 8224 / DSM 1558 / NBRC 9311 / NRRL Y-6157 / RJB 2259-6 / UBC 559-6) TaxID=578456 RepID=UPI0003F4A0FE|nr:uncharacterized protein TREMEDRAFT_69058 [Tremella mesenterica DSM 1558]EIW68539.1 hypothetical protein TREMEDRAFT_69058 [Tremella mesenterica DSM 1558]
MSDSIPYEIKQTPSDTISSLSTLAKNLDEHPTIPSFLNSLLSSHFPSSVDPEDPPDLVDLEKTLNELSTRLSLLSSDTSSGLEQSIHDISRNVPRLTYDLQFMRESATELHTSLSLVQDEFETKSSLQDIDNDRKEVIFEDDQTRTFKALEKLSHLDLLKNRMESARSVLREAESWSTLESEISSLISSQDWLKAGERLQEAAKSLIVFQNTPQEYETRKTLLTSLQNQLETSLGMALKESLEKEDIQQCSEFYKVFEMMDRSLEFQSYYFTSRRYHLIQTWSESVITDTGDYGDPNGVTFSFFLIKFYGDVLKVLEKEKIQIPQIFPMDQAGRILGSFIQTIFEGLTPSMQNRLTGLTDYYGAQALPELIKSFKATEELGMNIMILLDKVGTDIQERHVSGESTQSQMSISLTPINPTSVTPTNPTNLITSFNPTLSPIDLKTKSGILSTPRRFSRAIESSSTIPNHPTRWEITLYEPFIDLQTSYPTLERRYLSHILRTHPTLNSSTSRIDPAQLLAERAHALFTLSEEAVKRCIDFTFGYGAKGLLDSLNGFFEEFFDINQNVILDITKMSEKNEGMGDELDLEGLGLDYSTEDWGSFQKGLNVLKECKGVEERLGDFEKFLGEKIFEKSTPGVRILLEQSPLNSLELQKLLSSLSPPSLTEGHDSRARESLKSLTSSSQLFLQSIILSPLLSLLSDYPELPIWSQADKIPRRGELQIPSFSLSPTDTIARVSEGLLNLLRVFEVYAGDNGLSYSLETLPFVDLTNLMEEEEEVIGDVLDEEAFRKRSNSISGSTEISPTLGQIGTSNGTTNVGKETGKITPTGLVKGEGKKELSSESIISTWISSLALSFLSHLTTNVLPKIKSLSTHGANQMGSDLGYLSNAVRALDVEWEELERWKEVIGLDEVGWRELTGGEGKEEVWLKVGKMRGWV